MQHKEITEKIIGCAYHVYNKMGFGFLVSELPGRNWKAGWIGAELWRREG